MPVTRLTGRHARVDVSLDGITFTRTESDAVRRGTDPVHHLSWERVTGAELQTSRKGRPVVRVAVADADPHPDHRTDPHAIKVYRSEHDAAQRFVDEINEDVGVRRRWQEHAGDSGA